MSKVTEELAPASLPEMIKNIGLGLAEANQALAETGTDVIYTMPSAEVELSVAISMGESSTTSGEAGLSLSAVSVNASYSKTYDFNESASSRITVKLQAVPKSSPPPLDMTVRRLIDNLTNASEAVTTATATKKEVDANKESTAEQKTNAANAVKTAEAEVDRIKALLTTIKDLVKDIK